MSDDFPRFVAITWQHPTPYYDDSYAVNSVNNGPYQDALLTELVPLLEKQFRLIPEANARFLTGGSTGGWECAALQIQRPDFFGGALVLYPDPVDFRRNQLVDNYARHQRVHAESEHAADSRALHDANARGAAAGDAASDEPTRGRARQPRAERPAVRRLGRRVRTDRRRRLSRFACGIGARATSTRRSPRIGATRATISPGT